MRYQRNAIAIDGQILKCMRGALDLGQKGPKFLHLQIWSSTTISNGIIQSRNLVDNLPLLIR
jgi:hypothetical protein